MCYFKTNWLLYLSASRLSIAIRHARTLHRIVNQLITISDIHNYIYIYMDICMNLLELELWLLRRVFQENQEREKKITIVNK